MNVQRRSVEIRVSDVVLRFFFLREHFLHSYVQTSRHTKDIGALQKGADFVKAYALGFDVNVCLHIFNPLGNGLSDGFMLTRMP